MGCPENVRNPSHHLPSVPQQWSPSLQRYKYVCGNMQLMDALKSWLLIGRANLTFDQWPLASHSGASPFTSPSSFITTLLITVPVPKNSTQKYGFTAGKKSEMVANKI